MAYHVPVFNLSANIWRPGSPTSGAPDVVTDCNLALGDRMGLSPADIATSTSDWGSMWLLVPKDTDIRDGKALAGRDTVEVPAGTGRYYSVIWVDDRGLGFTNEHRFAVIIAISPWPTPFPGTTPTPPAPTATPVISGAMNAGDPPTVFYFTAPPGPMYLAVGTYGGVANATVASVGSVGTLGAIITTSMPAVGAVNPGIATYSWMHPGGLDGLALTEGFNEMVLFELFAINYPTLDILNQANGAAAPMTLTSGGSPAVVPQIAMGVLSWGTVITGGVFSTPFLGAPIDAVINTDLYGVPWTLQTTIANPSAGSPVTLFYSGSSPSTFSWGMIMNSFY